MKRLTYPFAFAIAACAILVACGGGAAPTATPTPSLGPTSQATSGAASTSGTSTLTLGAVSNGTVNFVTSSTVTVPQVNTASNVGVTLTASAPSGVATPSAATERGRFKLGVTPTYVFAYYALTFTNTVQITQSPGIVLTVPSNVSLSDIGNVYLVVTGATIANGWQEVASGSVAGQTLTFAPGAVSPSPLTLTGGTPYYFAVISTGPTVIPSPSPAGTGSPLPSTAPTAAGWTPYQIASGLQFPVQSGYDGAGQTVVVVGDYAPATTDVSAYLSANRITSAGANFSVVSINGGPGTSDSGGQLEATLDVETIAGLAPGANIEFYGMPDLTGASFTDAYTQLGSDTHATVMTASFGGCEYSGYSDTTQDPLLKTAAGNGVVMFASSGDQGNECFGPDVPTPAPSYAPGANFPASDPYVVGVGGQENFPNPDGTAGPSGTPTLTSTVAWNDYFFSGPSQGASGGGVSTLFTPPPYQVGLSGVASTTWRNVPDIAMPAENVAAYLNGSWQALGGTSWSAPQAAGLTAEINQYCGGSLVSLAGSNPVGQFYAAYANAHANFLDITSGNNQFAGSSPFYTAAAGYDNVTGLGVPYGMLVASSLCGGAPGAVALHRVRTMTHGIAAAPIDAYGEARDTSLGFVPHLGTDVGERGSAPVYVVLVMRATPTLATDEASVISSLQTAGFTIVRTYANHMAIDATAPAATVERYFQTSIHNMSQGQYGMRYGNVTPVVLPASIARVVHGAIVDDLVIARWFHHTMVPLH